MARSKAKELPSVPAGGNEERAQKRKHRPSLRGTSAALLLEQATRDGVENRPLSREAWRDRGSAFLIAKGADAPPHPLP